MIISNEQLAEMQTRMNNAYKSLSNSMDIPEIQQLLSILNNQADLEKKGTDYILPNGHNGKQMPNDSELDNHRRMCLLINMQLAEKLFRFAGRNKMYLEDPNFIVKESIDAILITMKDMDKGCNKKLDVNERAIISKVRDRESAIVNGIRHTGLSQRQGNAISLGVMVLGLAITIPLVVFTPALFAFSVVIAGLVILGGAAVVSIPPAIVTRVMESSVKKRLSEEREISRHTVHQLSEISKLKDKYTTFIHQNNEGNLHKASNNSDSVTPTLSDNQLYSGTNDGYGFDSDQITDEDIEHLGDVDTGSHNEGSCVTSDARMEMSKMREKAKQETELEEEQTIDMDSDDVGEHGNLPPTPTRP